MIERKFSIAHWDSVTESDLFLRAFENSSQEFKDSISDIYFGHYFLSSDGQVRYGNVMNQDASMDRIQELFTIQEKYGIPISLTLNDTIPDPRFLLDPKIQDEFVEYIRWFYDRGLRICTIGCTHTMNNGRLREEFPEMRWKNTVNNIVRDAQGVVDYAMLGYDTILINRSLHRDLPEVKRIRKAVDWFNENNPDRKKLEVSLLVSEGCINNCPWKSTHDYNWGGGEYFKHINNTCSTWRRDPHLPPELPRNTPDAFWYNKDDWEEYARYIDTFKYVGRVSRYEETDNPVMGWVKNPFTHQRRKSHHSFDEILEEEILLHQYQPGMMVESDNQFIFDNERMRKLGKVLKVCRGQCWNCHDCEDAYRIDQIVSLIGKYK